MVKLVIGNWKMHGRQSANSALLDALLADPRCDADNVAMAVPTAYLGQVGVTLAGRRMALAAQDVSRFDKDGAFTGEVSAGMLADLGCRYVLVGHSERRQYLAESAEVLAAKIRHVYASGMVPVYCVGETLAERESGAYVAAVLRQLNDVAAELKGRQQLIVAYEPVWAIGTGLVASPAQVAEMHEKLRGALVHIAGASCNISLLYGGSVKADNVDEIFALPQVDGALVGGASLDASQCRKICLAASN